jgi:hypothetical protein
MKTKNLNLFNEKLKEFKIIKEVDYKNPKAINYIFKIIKNIRVSLSTEAYIKEVIQLLLNCIVVLNELKIKELSDEEVLNEIPKTIPINKINKEKEKIKKKVKKIKLKKEKNIRDSFDLILDLLQSENSFDFDFVLEIYFIVNKMDIEEYREKISEMIINIMKKAIVNMDIQKLNKILLLAKNDIYLEKKVTAYLNNLMFPKNKDENKESDIKDSIGNNIKLRKMINEFLGVKFFDIPDILRIEDKKIGFFLVELNNKYRDYDFINELNNKIYETFNLELYMKPGDIVEFNDIEFEPVSNSINFRDKCRVIREGVIKNDNGKKMIIVRPLVEKI